MTYRIVLLFTLLSLGSLRGQKLVSAEAQDPVPAFVIALALGIPTEFDVLNYKILYNTVDAFGAPTTASGLLTIPADTSQAYPMTAYMHGTVLTRTDIPSDPDTQERFLVYGLATHGYITVAPDYLGYGENEGFHPYVHADTESQSGRDLLLAAREFLNRENIPFNEQLFITGYSQGGHAAQALHRDLQLEPGDDDLVVTAGAHLSGPYSISEVMRVATLEAGRPTLPGFIVYTYVSYNNVYGLYDSLEQAFVSPYVEVIDSFNRELIDGERFNFQLDTLLKQRDERLIDMFQDSIGQEIEENDPESPIIQALRDNDTYEWAPDAPTLLYYCTEDEQVPFQNAVVADSVMRALGSTSVLLESGGALDHGGCIRPAVTRTLAFFDSYAVRGPVSTRDRRLHAPGFSVSPNPAAAGDRLTYRGLPSGSFHYELLDLQGRRMLSGAVRDRTGIALSERLATGVYLLRLTDTEGRYLTRRVVLR